MPLTLNIENLTSEERIYQFTCNSCGIHGYIISSTDRRLSLICTQCHVDDGKQPSLFLDKLGLFKLGDSELKKFYSFTLRRMA